MHEGSLPNDVKTNYIYELKHTCRAVARTDCGSPEESNLESMGKYP